MENFLYDVAMEYLQTLFDSCNFFMRIFLWDVYFSHMIFKFKQASVWEIFSFIMFNVTKDT